MTRVVGLISKYFNHHISSSNIKHIKISITCFEMSNWIKKEWKQQGSVKQSFLFSQLILCLTTCQLNEMWLNVVQAPLQGNGSLMCILDNLVMEETALLVVFYVVMTTCQILSVVWSVLFLSRNDLHVTPDISRHIEVAFSKRGQCWTNFSMEHMEPEWDHLEII